MDYQGREIIIQNSNIGALGLISQGKRDSTTPLKIPILHVPLEDNQHIDQLI